MLFDILRWGLIFGYGSATIFAFAASITPHMAIRGRVASIFIGVTGMMWVAFYLITIGISPLGAEFNSTVLMSRLAHLPQIGLMFVLTIFIVDQNRAALHQRDRLAKKLGDRRDA